MRSASAPCSPSSQALRDGCLVLVEGGERHRFGKPSAALPEPVVIHVHDARLYGDVAFGGSVGAGEAYMRGYWTTRSSSTSCACSCSTWTRSTGSKAGSRGFTAPLRKAVHALRRNSRAGSRRNIAAHYDLGNEFFRLFLDETMMYSAAIFEHPRQIAARRAGRAARSHLPQARARAHGPPARDRHRLGRPRAARRAPLRLPRDHHHDLARAMDAGARARARGRASKAASRCCARTTAISPGTYDKLVSIEMIEAIGHEYYDTYFAQCARAARARRRDAAAGHHDRRPAL